MGILHRLFGSRARDAVVARTVGQVHAKGIIHRTLDLSNILVTEDGSAKLIGFGGVKILDSNQTPSPVAADIRSLGRMIVSAAEVLNEPLPEAVKAISARCEAAGSDQGYQSADEVADALDRFLRG